MYKINDRQIDYILSDISARGIEMEGLQLNLLDHICCIIEQELEENGDFEQGYRAVIRRFYRDKLSEIEEETHLLLNNKNYYVMKKVMIYSGTFSAAALTMGIFFKYMHWPGASVLMVLGIGICSLLFLPLLVSLKIKEQQKAKDKLLVVLGSISAITLALAILFKVQHWPGANIMGVTSPAILALVFLPIYFFGGIRNPETKLNTIVSSVLIILGCGLFFSLTITPQSMKIIAIRNTNSFLRSEQILKNEAAQVAKLSGGDSVSTPTLTLSKQILSTCEEMKAGLLEYVTGVKIIGSDFESKGEVIEDGNTQDYLSQNSVASAKLDELAKAVEKYNALTTVATNRNVKPIPMKYSIINTNENKVQYKVSGALNDIIQIQMLVLQNQRELCAPAQKELVSVQQ